MSNDIGNEKSSVVIVVPISSTEKAKRYPQNAVLPDGLPVSGSAICSQVRTIDKARLLKYECELDEVTMRRVDAALKVSLNL